MLVKEEVFAESLQGCENLALQGENQAHRDEERVYCSLHSGPQTSLETRHEGDENLACGHHGGMGVGNVGNYPHSGLDHYPVVVQNQGVD